MKILICHNYYIDRGGEDVVFEYEADTLQSKGYDVVLYCKHNKSINSFIKKIGVFLNFFFSFNTFREVKKIIKEEKLDIAHIHNIFPLISPSIYFVLKKYKIPVIQTIHNFRFFCSNGLCLKGGKICTKCEINRFSNIFNVCSDKKLYDFFLSVVIYFIRKFRIYDIFIDYFIVPSIFVRNKIIECGLSGNKIFIKRHSLNSKKIFIKENHYKINDDDKYFLFIGRLSEEKGIDNLIKIFKEIRKIKLKILGDGPLISDIRKLIERNKLNNIKMLGYVEGNFKNKLISNSLAVIIPSICFENCPLVLIESLMMGTPVVVNNIGALPEFISNGYNGFVYNNLKQLEEIILKLYSMDQSDGYKMRENCKKSFFEFFNEDKNFKVIDNIYKKAIEV
ncbi:MAG: glycosyltransferase family 1 protein [Candidatus Atribacteria bacterium]|nr:MAG: glycosyltransferase family 1 protein [Candidatus Atribacteria bacterium]